VLDQHRQLDDLVARKQVQRGTGLSADLGLGVQDRRGNGIVGDGAPVGAPDV
jgi:hypothetical protein